MQGWNYKFYDLDEIFVANLLHIKNIHQAWLIKDLVNFYCNSSIRNIDELLLEEYKNFSSPQDAIKEILKNNKDLILKGVKTVLSKMKTKEIPATHDFYLKLFALHQPKLNYDIILIDEAQDISGVMIGLIQSQKANKIYVGDMHQQIYRFRFAINSLKQIDLEQYNLSKSFRFGNEYALHLQNLLSVGYKKLNDTPLNLKGVRHKTKIGIKFINKKHQICIIARSNLTLFEMVLQYTSNNKKIYFEGNYASYSFMNKVVFSLLKLKQKDFSEISHSLIKQFDSFDEIKKYANETQNYQLKSMISLVDKYETKLFHFNKEIKNSLVQTKEGANIIFTTAHKAKGQEYDQVIMANDFITLNDIEQSLNEIDVDYYKLIEELNIFYVAASRAKKVISLAPFLDTLNKNVAPKVPTKLQTKITTKAKDNKRMKSKIDEWLKQNGY